VFFLCGLRVVFLGRLGWFGRPVYCLPDPGHDGARADGCYPERDERSPSRDERSPGQRVSAGDERCPERDERYPEQRVSVGDDRCPDPDAYRPERDERCPS
jgi:hypothetical protein